MSSTGNQVSVSANDDASVNDGAGSLAVGVGGVGASIDVITLKNAVDAHIGANSTVTGNTNVAVNAVATREVDSTVVAFGGGLSLGIAGGVSVISIGSGIDSQGASQVAPAQGIANSSVATSSATSVMGTDPSGTGGGSAPATITVSLSADPTATGTTAYVGQGASVTATTGTLNVTAQETDLLNGSHSAT